MPHSKPEFNGCGMAPHVIRSLLMMQQVKLKDIAAECEVSLPVVSEVINRKCTSTMVMTAIAQKLGLPFDAVWVCDYRKETK